MSRRGRLFAIAATMLCVPEIAHALGLGNLTVYTALNEPLKAEIRFTSLTKKEFRTLDARLIARPRHFAGIGIESTAPFSGIGIALVEREPQVYSLLFQSARPMREPFLRLILEIEWAGGRLVREFTTLIDPRELRAPNEEGMPEFPSVAKAEDLGRRDSEASGRTHSKSVLTASVDEVQQSTPKVEQTEAPPEQSTTAPQSEIPTTQESTAEATVSKADLAASPTPGSTQPIPSVQVQIEMQRHMIQAEIENWAKERGLSTDNEPKETIVSDVDAKIPSGDDVVVKTPEINLDTSKPSEMPEAVAPSAQTSSDGPLGHDLLMVFIGLVAALVLVVGGVLIRIYVRQRRAFGDHVQHGDDSRSEVEPEVVSQIERAGDDDVEDLPEYGDRRSRRGRRRQFMPVKVERREGARRQRDQLSQDNVDTVRASTMDESEVYMACGHDENAELLLREALAKDPDRQDLKVKLLAVYQRRDDPEAFDALASELYSNVDPKKIGDGNSELDGPDRKLTEVRADDDAQDSDSVDSLDDKHEVDAEIFEREIEALAMTIPADSDTGTLDSEPAPANENLNDGTMESLQVNDLAEIKRAVDRGVGLLESDKGSEQDDIDQPRSMNAATGKSSRKFAKRSRNRSGKPRKSSVQGNEEESSQWKEPSTKIDLAKAYIAMGDAERARSILDEVIEEWNSRDGTQG